METSLGARPSWIEQPFLGGTTPHFYSLRRTGDVAWSHRLTAIASRRLDEEALAFWLAGLDAPDPARTVHANVRRLLPGERLELTSGEVTTAVAQPRFREWMRESAATLSERLRQALFAAVDRATRDGGKIAVLLGGVDSSAVLSVLTRLRSPSAICAVTVDFPGRNSDRPFAEALCRSLGVHLSIVRPRDWAPLRKFVVLDGVPYGTIYGGGELAAYQRAAELGADRVVTGIPGDAIFGGCVPQIGSDMLWRAPLRALRLALWSELPDEHSTAVRLRRFLLAPNVRRMPRPVRVARARRQWSRAMPWATKRFHELLAPGLDIAWRRYDVPRDPQEAFRSWASSPELTTMVEVSSALAAEAGVTWRDALADRDLVDMLCAVPIERLFDGARFRGLLRRALVGILPEPALSRATKAEFEASPAILAPEDQAVLRDLMNARELERLGFVDVRALRTAFDSTDNYFWLWRFLAAEAFLRELS